MNTPNNTRQNPLEKVPQAVWLLLASVVGAVLAVAAVGFFFPDANRIKIGFPDGRLELSVEQDDVLQHETLLDTLFANKFFRPAVVEWLKENEDLYHLADASFADMLAQSLPPLSDESLEDYTDRATELIEANPLLKALRGQAERHEPPFQYIGKRVRIGVPSSDLSREYIYVPFDSEFEGRMILLMNPKNDRELKRKGRGGFPKVGNVDFQLHKDLARELFGRVAHKTVEGVAFIVPVSEVASIDGPVPVQQTRLTAR